MNRSGSTQTAEESAIEQKHYWHPDNAGRLHDEIIVIFVMFHAAAPTPVLQRVVSDILCPL
jgi:hypothetical protein